MIPAKKEIALCLSSGGARGLAQIGVIEELINRGYTIKAVGGSSIGSAVGGFYAAGQLNTFKEWIITLGKMDVFNLFDFTLGSSGFIKGERVFTELEKVTGDFKIEDLPVAFTAVSTDIVKREEIWIRNGSLLQAIRCSTAIPTWIMPVFKEDKILVDGGVLAPLPLQTLINYPWPIVAVNVNCEIPYHFQYKPTAVQQEEINQYLKYLNDFKNRWAAYFYGTEMAEYENQKVLKKEEVKQLKQNQPMKMGYYSLLSKTYDLMSDQLIEMNIKSNPPELMINISRYACGTFEFYKAKELIEAGRIAANNALDHYEKIIH